MTNVLSLKEAGYLFLCLFFLSESMLSHAGKRDSQDLCTLDPIPGSVSQASKRIQGKYVP
jgi:hypothetical protein